MAGSSPAEALRLLTLARPDKANALDPASVATLAAGVAAAAAENAPFAFRAEGRVFCGGFDFTGVETQSEGDLLLRFAQIELLLQAVSTAPVVSLALVDGAAFGAGADLVAACTYRLGTAKAKFRFPGFRFGVALGTRRLAALVGTDMARAILLENRTLDAPEALRVGLLTHIVEPEELPATAERLLAAHDGLPPGAAARLLRLTGTDSGDEDLAELVRSLAPAGLHARIARYRGQH
ncbi:enoyl-CoA hydratase/isomerase family protein [Ancylobacter sp.]|uniref:enoyl-CoA hydratase/isomerase family protein n=1 Tax=Ancylobacter sp. TaxID=1872567 RepID=UPI003D141E0A